MESQKRKKSNWGCRRFEKWYRILQNKTQSDDNTLPSGIRFRKNRNAYQVYWNLNGKQKAKYFALSKFGEDALKLAIIARNEFIDMANNNGASFTDRHGV